MLALSWMGAGAGFVGMLTRRVDPRIEVATLAVYAWVWGFLYGAIMNLWFWPFARGGSLDWHPGLDLAETLHRYWQFYVATSLGWDAAAAITNALLVLVTGLVLMRTLRRFAHRLDPAVEFTGPPPPEVASLERV
jgi:energy-coupling factor transport system substrate-specific component